MQLRQHLLEFVNPVEVNYKLADNIITITSKVEATINAFLRISLTIVYVVFPTIDQHLGATVRDLARN